MSETQDIAARDAKAVELFSTPLLVSRPANADRLNAALEAAIVKRRAEHPGMRRSNILGWHSDHEMLKWGGDAARALAIETMTMCARFTDDIGATPGKPRFEWGIEMWANVSPAGASNQFHTHPGAYWSAVYFVNDGGADVSRDNEGALILLDPRSPMNRMYAPDLVFKPVSGERQRYQHVVAPEPGKLIAFPSWLSHSVRPHSAAGERISIAMNLMAAAARI